MPRAFVGETSMKSEAKRATFPEILWREVQQSSF